MITELKDVMNNAPKLSGWEWFWRVGWIGIRLVLVYIMADQFQPFFYQAF